MSTIAPTVERADERPALRETRRAIRLLGLGVLLMTALMSTGPMVVHLAATAPAAWPGTGLLLVGQVGCLLALTRRTLPRAVPWVLLSTTAAGLAWMLLHRAGNSATDWAPGYWSVPLVALAMAHLSRREYYLLTATGVVTMTGLISWLAHEPGWLFTLDQAWVLQPMLATLLFGDALLRVAESRDRGELERLGAQLARSRAALQDHDRRETTRMLHDHVLHALHGLGRASLETRVLVVEDCRTACEAVEVRRRHQADQLIALASSGGATSAGPGGTAWHITPNPQTRRALVNTVWPGMGAALATALLAGPRMERPGLLVPLALAVVLVGALSALELRRRALQPWIGVLLVSAAVVGWQVNLALAPQDTSTVYTLWLAWIVSPIIHLVALSAPVAVSASVAGAWLALQTAGLLWHFEDPGQVVALSSTVTTGAGECIVTVLVLAVVRRQAAREARALDVAAELTDTTRRLHDAYRQDLEWSERVAREALPLLRAVADGELEAHDDQVRQLASRLETTVRDQLLLGHEQEPLALALHSAREEGWQVSSSLDSEDEPRALAAMTRLLGLLGSPSRPGQPLMLSVTSAGASAVALGALAAEQQERWAALEEIGATVDLDEDFARLHLAPTDC